MCLTRGRPENFTGDPLRRLWTPRINKINGSQGIQTWFLLADGFGRRGEHSPGLRWMPEICKADSRTGSGPKDNTNHMAFCSMGYGHGWTFPAVTWQENSSLGSSGQVHKVGRGPSRQQLLSSYSSQISEENHIQIRVSPRPEGRFLLDSPRAGWRLGGGGVP